jgi:predicted DNA-binding transcriptional regulator AlpA
MLPPSEYKGEVKETEESTEFCTVRDAARLSGLADKTWYEGRAGTASVPRIRFGRSVRLRRKDVEQFIQDRIREAEQQMLKSDSAGSAAGTRIVS